MGRRTTVSLCMSLDHIIRLADLKLIRDGAELEAELSTKAPGWFITIHRRMRNKAAEAIAALAANVDPSKPDDIRALQVIVRVYDEWVEQIRRFVAEGMNLQQRMTDEEHEEALEIIGQFVDREEDAIAAGIVDPSHAETGPMGS